MRTKRSRTKRIRHRTKRIRHRTKHRKTNRRGGTAAPLRVIYGTTLIKADENLKGKTQLYKQTPTIDYNPKSDITYLITMTDPDAPAGEQSKQTWTHYVLTLKANKIVKEFYPYQPPSPPANTGDHRYIFKTYVYFDSDADKLNKNNLTGNDYYKQILEPVIKNKAVLDNFQFKVSS
jgi:phosphatidylethanolamine-binding protein (PEBP) family uncharacterized protein